MKTLEQKEKAIDNINNYFKRLRNKFNIKPNFKTLEIEKQPKFNMK